MNTKCFLFYYPVQRDESALDGSVLVGVDKGMKAEMSSRRSAVQSNSTYNSHL